MTTRKILVIVLTILQYLVFEMNSLMQQVPCFKMFDRQKIVLQWGMWGFLSLYSLTDGSDEYDSAKWLKVISKFPFYFWSILSGIKFF